MSNRKKKNKIALKIIKDVHGSGNFIPMMLTLDVDEIAHLMELYAQNMLKFTPSKDLAEKIIIRLNRYRAGLSNAAIGHVMDVLDNNIENKPVFPTDKEVRNKALEIVKYDFSSNKMFTQEMVINSITIFSNWLKSKLQ